jgi:hypothetical protein
MTPAPHHLRRRGAAAHRLGHHRGPELEPTGQPDDAVEQDSTVGTAAAARLGRKRRGRAELDMRTLLNGAALRVALVARIKGTVNSRETRRSAGHGTARMDT